MSRSINQLDNERFRKKMWRGFALFLGILVIYQGWVYKGQQNVHTLHIPPDLSQGVTQSFKEIPLPNIYTFTAYIHQQLNRWQENGDKDYIRNIKMLRHYLTPRYYQFLVNEFEKKQQLGELRGRTRGISEMPGHSYDVGKVKTISTNTWAVELDVQIQEWFRNMEVKSVNIRYPLRVVRFDIDRERNPWGLAIDGYTAQPIRILSAEQEEQLKALEEQRDNGA